MDESRAEIIDRVLMHRNAELGDVTYSMGINVRERYFK